MDSVNSAHAQEEREVSDRRSCSECVHALFEDYGYSNYTVEGTDFACKIGKHPDGIFDRFYGEDPRLEFAGRCPDFVAGEAEEHAVDCPSDCGCEGKPFQRQIIGAMGWIP